jgi:SAM-dependent methyltransferase
MSCHVKKIPRLSWALSTVASGDYGKTWFYVRFRFWRFAFRLIYLMLRIFPVSHSARNAVLTLETKHPIAFESPDHIAPCGTAYDNSTNGAFVLLMDDKMESERPGMPHGILDLGCSGGQLVKDFKGFGWFAVGLEGSDYSAKHGRANWPELHGKNLFTCDITKPFQVRSNGTAAQFDIITAWEVLEHIHVDDLPALLDNVRRHLRPGGMLVASTCSGSCEVDGVELHQTRWSNSLWKQYFEDTQPWAVPADPGLKLMHHVRVIHGEESFLYYRKRAEA